jgi:hypothetical protein
MNKFQEQIHSMLSEIVERSVDSGTSKESINVIVNNLLESGAVIPKFPLYSRVYIVDIYDIDNDCSQIGNGKVSKNIERRIRKCSVISYSVPDKVSGILYYVLPVELTERESNGLESFYWEKSYYDYEIYATEEEALLALKKGI